MALKVYETPTAIYHLDVDGRKAVREFTDTDDKTHVINHLWFFDPELVDSVTQGSYSVHDTIRWINKNSRELNIFKLTMDYALLDVFMDNYDLDFPLWRDISDYILPFHVNAVHATPVRSYFVLAEVPVEPVAPRPSTARKPTYIVASFGYIGRSHFVEINRTVAPWAHSSAIPSTIWNKMHNYSFKMNEAEFNFFRKTPRDTPFTAMFGMELEISTDLTSKELDHIIQQVEPKQEPFCIFKPDVSISGRFENKIEMVTVPCTPRYLKQAWKIFFDKLERLAKAKDKEVSDYIDCSKSLTNGIHIHVSKQSFGSSLHERKFMTLFNQWDTSTVEFLTKLSGRPHKRFDDNNYCRVDHNYVGYTLARRLKNRTTGDRSVCHNRNAHTVEVRLYQGIFDLKHINTCIEMTEAMREFADICSFSNISRHFRDHFTTFVAKAAGYRNLKETLSCA